jgi:hypothetical protein
MKTTLKSCCTALLLLATTLCGNAAEPEKAKTGSPEFERMKTLVGTWTGKTDMGQGPVDMTIEYSLVAAGTAIQERIAPGTPHEMVSMYYDKAGKLAMTHYCVLGNRPEMTVKSSDSKSITFDLDAACCTFDPKKESHMSGTTLRFDDADTISSSCKGIMNGQAIPEKVTVWKRVKDAKVAAK